MYPRPKTVSRAPCSGHWWNSVGIESNWFSRYIVWSFLLCRSCYMRLVCSKIQFENYFTEIYLSNNILFFGWVYCLLQKSLELQPNPNYFNQEISLPCLRVNSLIRKRKLRTGDKTATTWDESDGTQKEFVSKLLKLVFATVIAAYRIKISEFWVLPTRSFMPPQLVLWVPGSYLRSFGAD